MSRFTGDPDVQLGRDVPEHRMGGGRLLQGDQRVGGPRLAVEQPLGTRSAKIRTP